MLTEAQRGTPICLRPHSQEVEEKFANSELLTQWARVLSICFCVSLQQRAQDQEVIIPRDLLHRVGAP